MEGLNPSVLYTIGIGAHAERIAQAERAVALARDETAIGPVRAALAALLVALAGRLAPATRAQAVTAH